MRGLDGLAALGGGTAPPLLAVSFFLLGEVVGSSTLDGRRIVKRCHTPIDTTKTKTAVMSALATLIASE